MATGPLRVCFISHQYPPAVGGGIGRFTADLAQGFAKAGHDVHVMSAQGYASTVSLEDGVWVHRFPAAPFAVGELRSEPVHGDLLRIASVYREVAAAHRVRPFDIVSSPVWLAEGLLVAMDPRFVSVVSLHTSTKTLMQVDAHWAGLSISGPLTELERQCIQAHRHTHANSAASLAKITEEYGCPNGAFMIHHGVEDRAARFAGRRKTNGRVRILVTGRQEMRKGADILLDIIPMVLGRFPNAEFVLVGQTVSIAEFGRKSLAEALAERIPARSDGSRRVKFTGTVPDDELDRHYAAADIFLFPSRYESFGLPVIEAMSFRLPVIACNTGAIGEIVANGEHGILVDVEDRNGLVEAIGELILDAPKRQRYAAAARSRYESHFSIDVSVPRAIAAYRAIAAERTAPKPDFSAAPDASLIERFAKTIEDVTRCRGAAAAGAARQLIGEPALPAARPHVAVVVTCFNYAGYVAQALDSVAAQTYRDFECVVVDDASTDNSARAIEQWIAARKDPRFVMVRNDTNRGQMASFAAGLAASKGEFVAFLDADDFWFPEFLQQHVDAHLHRIPSASVSCSDLVQIDGEQRLLCGTFGSPVFYPDRGNGFIRIRRHEQLPVSARDAGNAWQAHIPPGYLPYPWSVTSGMVFRRELLDVVMPRDPGSIRICADSYLFVLCHYFTGSHAIKRALGAYRRHGKNGFGYLPVYGAVFISPQGWVRDNQRILARGMLRGLLDRYDVLAEKFAPARVRGLMRRLLRECLQDDLSFELSRVRAVLGRGRVFRDRVRARLQFLRRRPQYF